MTLSIKYTSEIGAKPIAEYLQEWKDGYVTSSGWGVVNGGFSGRETPLVGDQYAIVSRITEFAIIAESATPNGLKGEVNYYLAPGSTYRDFFWGELDVVKLGQGLEGRSNYLLNENVVSFGGLDVKAERVEGGGNPVDNLINSLAAGKIDLLDNILNKMLNSLNLSTASTFDQVAAAAPSVAIPSTPLALAGGGSSEWDWAFAA